MTDDEIRTLATEVGAVSYTRAPMRAVVGVSMTYEQLEHFARLCIAQGLEMGAGLCLNESVEDDATGAPEDRAYNIAIKHCQKALRDMAAEMLK